jgi:hypothetical protein
MATSGLARRAAILRAPANVDMTTSVPVQWNNIGNTRGVPSAATIGEASQFGRREHLGV